MFFLFVLSMVLFSCEQKSAINVVRNEQVIPDQVFIGPRIIVTESGLTSAIIRAKRVKVYEELRYTALEDSIEIRFFNKEGKHTSTLTSDKGDVWGLHEVVDSLRVQGNVVVVSIEKNAELRSEDLKWVKNTKRVFSDSLVTIKSEDGYERGTGFSAIDDLSEYEFRNQVNGEFQSEDIKLFDDKKRKEKE